MSKAFNNKRKSGSAAALIAGGIVVGAASLAAAVLAMPRLAASGEFRAAAKTAYNRLRGKTPADGSVTAPAIERAPAPLRIYADALGDGWQDWSWAERNLASTENVFEGTNAARFLAQDYKGVYLHHEAFGTGGWSHLEFWVAGSDKTPLTIAAADAKATIRKGVPLEKYRVESGYARGRAGWARVRVPLEDLLGVSARTGVVTGFVFQAGAANSGNPVPVLLDSVTLIPDQSLPPTPAVVTIPVSVDAARDRHPISPYIYGLAHAPRETLATLGATANRWGGNGNSRFNWTNNSNNAARDWEWRNQGDDSKKNGAATDSFIRDNAAAGAVTLFTVPTLGWVSRNSDNNVRSVNVPAEGGPGIRGADGPIAGYDPTENQAITSLPSVAREKDARPGAIAQESWIKHNLATFGATGAKTMRFYAMDNEPDLWSSTHTDVHPGHMGYDDLLARFLTYATMVKDTDPAALVTGPVSWGWTGYQYSPLDKGTDNFRTHADRRAHGDTPFLLWFLQQLKKNDTRSGRRTLDVLDIHFYPQGAGVYGGKADAATRALRLRSARALYDPTYTDESWIGEPVRLIPRLKEWIAQGYPGTPIGITEWNFGGNEDITAGLSVVDALGIFGREGVFLANYWTYPGETDSFGSLGFRLLRRSDNGIKGFGDTSVYARSGDGSGASFDRVSAFAAEDSANGDLTIVLVNKLPGTKAVVPITVTGWKGAGSSIDAGRIRAWQFDAAHPKTLRPVTATASTGAVASLTLPPYSATLLRIPAASRVTPPSARRKAAKETVAAAATVAAATARVAASAAAHSTAPRLGAAFTR